MLLQSALWKNQIATSIWEAILICKSVSGKELWVTLSSVKLKLTSMIQNTFRYTICMVLHSQREISFAKWQIKINKPV